MKYHHSTMKYHLNIMTYRLGIYHMASRLTYQNISPEVTRKPWRVMPPDAEGIELLDRTLKMSLVQGHPLVFAQNICYIRKEHYLF